MSEPVILTEIRAGAMWITLNRPAAMNSITPEIVSGIDRALDAALGNMDTRAVVLIGVKGAKAVGLDCGACGFPDCKSFEQQAKRSQEFSGPICAFRLLDMGIALGSAVKTAGLLNVDNRIMYRIGTVARETQMVDWDFVMGIPLAATGKNIFFDR